MSLELLLADHPEMASCLTAEDRAIIQESERVDRIDRLISPVESVLQAYGGPFLYACGVALEVYELAVLKTPFVVRYLRRTGDVEALYSWLPREMIGVFVPFGDMVDLTTAYHDRVLDYYEQRLLAQRGEEKGR